MKKANKKLTWKRFKRKAHNFILITITVIAVILFILSACYADSDTYLPLYIMCGCMAWLGTFAYANCR